jgi:hypothetical protein
VAQTGDAVIMAAGLLVRALITAAVGASFLVSPAVGQWMVGLDVGADRFWGGSEEIAPEHRSFRPYRPTTFGATLERSFGSGGVGLRLLYAGASLALEGSDAVVAAKGVFKVYSASPEVSYRIASVGSSSQVLLRVGPLFEVWSIVDEKSRTRIGIQGAASLGIPLGGRFAGTLSAGAALIPSPFEDGELQGFDLRALWRRRFAAGLQYRL